MDLQIPADSANFQINERYFTLTTGTKTKLLSSNPNRRSLLFWSLTAGTVFLTTEVDPSLLRGFQLAQFNILDLFFDRHGSLLNLAWFGTVSAGTGIFLGCWESIWQPPSIPPGIITGDDSWTASE